MKTLVELIFDNERDEIGIEELEASENMLDNLLNGTHYAKQEKAEHCIKHRTCWECPLEGKCSGPAD